MYKCQKKLHSIKPKKCRWEKKYACVHFSSSPQEIRNTGLVKNCQAYDHFTFPLLHLATFLLLVFGEGKAGSSAYSLLLNLLSTTYKIIKTFCQLVRLLEASQLKTGWTAQKNSSLSTRLISFSNHEVQRGQCSHSRAKAGWLHPSEQWWLLA